MGFSLNCRDTGMDCDFRVSADTREELLSKVAAHAKTAHNMSSIPADVMAKVQAAIKTT